MKKILASLIALATTSQVFAASDLQLKDLWIDNAKQKIYTKLCNIGDDMAGSNQVNMTFSKIVNPIVSKSYVPTIYLIKSQCVDAFMDKSDISATDNDTIRVNISGAKGETNFSNNTLTRFPNGSLDYSTGIVYPSSSSSVSNSSVSSSSSYISSSASSSSVSSNSQVFDFYVKEFLVTPSQKDIKITVCNTGIGDRLNQVLLKNVQTGLTFIHNGSSATNACYDIHRNFSEMGINYISGANYDIQVLLNHKKEIFETNYNNNAFDLNIVYNNRSWKTIDPNAITFSGSTSSSSSSNYSSSSYSSVSSYSSSAVSSIYPSFSGSNISLDGYPTVKKYCRVMGSTIRVCVPYQGVKIKVDRAYNQYQKAMETLNMDQKISKINATIIELKTKYSNLTNTSDKLAVEYMLFKLSALRLALASQSSIFDIKSILN